MFGGWKNPSGGGRKGVEEKGMTGSVGAGRASDIFYFLIDFWNISYLLEIFDVYFHLVYYE